jgi:hypothetical protein
MNTVEFVDGNAPGISAALLNEPFHLKGASYDGSLITVTIGPCRANFGGGLSGIVEKLSDSTLTISAPAPMTTYYIFIQYDGSFSYSTSSSSGMGVLIGSVATGEQVTALTRDDLRGILPGPVFLRAGGIQIFNSVGTFIVPAGVTTVYVTMCGGGGGGGDYYGSYDGGNGGNADVVFMQAVQVTPGQNISVTIGAGGSAGGNGDSGISGATGGTSSFGSYVSCFGGDRGTAASSDSNGIDGYSYSDGGFFRNQGYRGRGGYEIRHPLGRIKRRVPCAGTSGICIVQW